MYAKLYEVFRLYISSENIVVLDSTTNEKYSKHLILVLKNSLWENDCENNSISKELLFRSNIEINYLIQLILFDITDEAFDTQNRSSDVLEVKETNNNKINFNDNNSSNINIDDNNSGNIDINDNNSSYNNLVFLYTLLCL